MPSPLVPIFLLLFLPEMCLVGSPQPWIHLASLNRRCQPQVMTLCPLWVPQHDESQQDVQQQSARANTAQARSHPRPHPNPPEAPQNQNKLGKFIQNTNSGFPPESQASGTVYILPGRASRAGKVRMGMDAQGKQLSCSSTPGSCSGVQPFSAAE